VFSGAPFLVCRDSTFVFPGSMYLVCKVLHLSVLQHLYTEQLVGNLSWEWHWHSSLKDRADLNTDASDSCHTHLKLWHSYLSRRFMIVLIDCLLT
jgi:hypothetical protein